MDNILVSRPEASRLAGITPSHLRVLVSKGRIVERDALINGTVRKGITLASRSRDLLRLVAARRGRHLDGARCGPRLGRLPLPDEHRTE